MNADHIATFLVQLLLCFPAISLLLLLGLHVKHQQQQINQWREMFNESEAYAKNMSNAYWQEVREHSETMFALDAALGYPLSKPNDNSKKGSA